MAIQRWIHCGLCFQFAAKSDTKFYHLSCLDVLCRACMVQTKRGTVCPVCSAPIRKFTELGEGMSKREKVLYHPAPNEFYHIATQTLLFQQRQRQRLVKAILEARHSLPRLDQLETQIHQKVVETQRRYENLRNFRRNLQDNMRKSMVPVGGSSGASQQLTQRRMSMCTPSTQTRPCAVLLRRYSVDSSHCVKLSQANTSNDSGIDVTTPSSSKFSGNTQSLGGSVVPKEACLSLGPSPMPLVGLNSASRKRMSASTLQTNHSMPSSDPSFGGSVAPKKACLSIGPSPMPSVELNRTSQRRMSVSTVQTNLPMPLSQRRYSVDSSKQINFGQRLHGFESLFGSKNVGRTSTAITDFYARNSMKSRYNK